MPERKGRKRRMERQRTRPRDREGAPPPRTPQAPGEAPSREPEFTTRPALRWRYAGFFLGVMTMFFGVLTVAQGVSSGGVNAGFLLVAGSFLVALAVVLGALAIAPDRVRALFVRDGA
jgi:hypothetical protein